MIAEYIVISVALIHSLKILDTKPIVAIKLVAPIQITLYFVKIRYKIEDIRNKIETTGNIVQYFDRNCCK